MADEGTLSDGTRDDGTLSDGTLSDSDWDVLVAVPFAVFLLVAYADGRLAAAERRAFAAVVDGIGARARSTDDAVVREVMGRISRDRDQIMERLDPQVVAGLPFYDVFAAAGSVLDDMPQRETASAFREAMIHLAEEVAGAWPILGRRTSVEEARSISFIRDQLGLRDHAEARS